MPILIALAVAGFCSALCVRILDPMIPAIAREFAADPKHAALLATAFALPYAIGQPILGPLGDALGKARIIKLCLIVMGVSLVLAALAQTLDQLFAVRVVMGLACGGIIPLSFAIVGDRFAMADRQVAISQVLSAILIGGFVGGFISGIIGDAYGWRAVLWLLAAITVVVIGATASGLQPRADAVRKPFTVDGILTGMRQVFANPLAVVCYGAVFIEGITIFGMMPYLAVILEETKTGSIREAGFIIAGFGLGGFLFTLVVRRLLTLFGDSFGLMRVGGFLCAAFLVVFALAGPWPIRAAAFMGVGFTFYMLHNSLQTQATELAPTARGSAVAFHAFFFFLGHAVGPLVFGPMHDRFGTAIAVLISAAIVGCLGAATAAALQARGQPRSA
jgi:predicted MFS family arabinose efflux permease